MSTELAVLEQQLQQHAPDFTEALAGRMPVERLMRTMLVSAERNPKLLQCSRQSLLNSAMTAAILGLEVDGVTGQAWIIPYKEHAQLVIGYKGYNTMGARSGYIISGACVREGDKFAYQLGSSPFVNHVPAPKITGRITHAWATARSKTLPEVVSVLTVDEVNDVMRKSPGARKPDSPWNDPAIGYPAMAEKTAKRRLARSMPLNLLQYAARLEEAYDEQGKHAWIDPAKGVQIEGEAAPLVQREAAATPSADELIAGTPPGEAPSDTASAAHGPASVTQQAGAGTLSLEDMAREAAKRGRALFNVFWKGRSRTEQDKLQSTMAEELRQLMDAADGK